jgi:glycosyltransferase involved in cell wall biosynthesis
MTGLAGLSLVCLAPDTVVPPANGSAARTFGLAAAVRPHLGRVAIHAFSAAPAPPGPEGLEVVHLHRPDAGLARLRYLAGAVLGPTLGFDLAGRLDDTGSLVQLESPLLFEAARRAGLRRFVLNAHNVYQDMTAFPQASLRDRIFYRVTRRRQARIETACWREAAHVVFCSRLDRDRAERLSPGVAGKSTVVPNCVEVRRFTPRPPAAFAAGGPVVFVGTMRYPPNFFAAEEICHHLAPALPALQFHIVGEAPWRPGRIPANVRFAGRVASTTEPLAGAQVAVAPVRHGSGTRLKLLEYFAAGLPVVCTAKAAEGLDVEDRRHLWLAETPRQMADAVGALHADPAECARLGAAARALVKARYDWAAHVPGLLEIYENVVKNG